MTEEEKIAAAVAEALKPIKESLNNSYAARDAAEAKAKALEAEKQAVIDAAEAQAKLDKKFAAQAEL